MGKATNPRLNARSNGGRPRQDGERYPGGRLKPQPPNLRVVETRAAFGLTKAGQKFTPIEVAFLREWVEEDVYQAAATYAALHRLAVTGGPTVPTQRDQSTPDGAAVRALSFAHLTNKEIAAIWDSAMPAQASPETDDGRRQRATQRWKEINAAMTPAQREEVFNVVVLDSWPQWILQRAAGRFTTSWERKRDLLISGLTATFGRRNILATRRGESQ